MIVKLQKPLATSVEPPQVLVYDKQHRTSSGGFMTLIPMSEYFEDLFKRYGLEEFMKAKFFAEAHVEGDTLVIDRPLLRDLGW